MSIEIRATVDFSEMQAAHEEALKLSIYDIADAVHARSQDLVPVAPYKGGTLKSSGNVQYGDMSAIVGYNTPYAIFVHEGTRPHDIYPKNKKFLMFAPSGAVEYSQKGQRKARFTYSKEYTESNVNKPLYSIARMKKFSTGVLMRFARHVYHPGTRPVPFLRDALNEVIPQIPEIVKKRLEESR